MRRIALIVVLAVLTYFLAAETVLTGAGTNTAEVLSSTASETIIQYRIGKYEKTPVKIDDSVWYQINMAKEGKLLEAGHPDLPVFNRSIIIDDQALMKLEVYDVEYMDAVLPVAPSKGNLYRNVNPDDVPWTFDSVYSKSEFWPGEIASLGEPYILRDYRGIVIQTSPFAYNPKTKTLRQYTSFKVRVYADGFDTVNTITRSRENISREFVDIYSNQFLNWSTDRYTPVDETFGTLLIIYHPDFYDQVVPLFEWKRQKGVPTIMISTAIIGSNAAQIQSYIQNYYNIYPSLTFVLLVGDHDRVSALVHAGGGADPILALVAGSDSYPDIFVGRVSATTTAEVSSQVYKILTSERDLGSTASWLISATGIASNLGPGDDGEYDWEHLDNIRTDLLGYGYWTVDQIYDPGVSSAQVTAAINAGRSLVNYTGHGSTTSWTTTGFNNSDVAALSNGIKNPVIVSVACQNGNFTNATCFAEAWLRKNLGGAIGFYGSSINQSWNPPMAAQDEIADLLVADTKITLGGLFFNGACKMLDKYPSSGPDMYKTWNIFGDPSLLYRSKNPTDMTVSYNNYREVGQAATLYVSTGTPNAYVAVSKNNVIHASGYTNSAGNITLTLSSLATTPAEFTVTVTAHNKKTWVGKLYQGQIWTGNLSTVWAQAGNWNTLTVPVSSNDVLIPAGCTRYPITSTATGYCKNLTVENGTSFTVGGYDLIVSVNANISGQLNIISNKEFKVLGNVIWASGSSVSITDASAWIICNGHMSFESGSNFNMTTGYLSFEGSTTSYLYNYSTATRIFNLRSAKSAGFYTTFHNDSTCDFFINGSVWCYNGSGLYCWYNGNVTVKGLYLRDYNTGSAGIMLYYGTLIMDGNTQQLDLLGSSCYVNNLVISPASAVNLTQNLSIRNDLTLESGIFNANNWNITIGGNWIRTAAANVFNAASSTVIFNGSGHQYCNSTETFHNLVVNKSGGALRINNSSAVVTCASYDWIAGAVDVLSGTFTVNRLAADLIEGAWYLNDTGTINIYAGTGRTIHLGGELHIYGGNFNVYGGAIRSQWPHTNNALIEMSGGILDFHNQGVWINSIYPALTLTENITGGSVRMVGSLSITRSDFNPTGGIIEMYGGGDHIISHDAGSNLYNLIVNKGSARSTYESGQDDPEAGSGQRANTLTADSNLEINGYFYISSGTFVAPAIMNVRGSWYNYQGEAAFVEGSGRVIFDGNTFSTIYGNEVFYTLELAKSLQTVGLQVAPNYSVTCSSYKYTQGILKSIGGSFTALDLADAVIRGTLQVDSGYVHLHQDGSQYLDLQGNLIINGGELHLYGGGFSNTYMPYGGDAYFEMTGGLLHRHDRGITINDQHVFTTLITGGTIRIDDSFICWRTNFNPSGGLIQMVGPNDAYLSMVAGTLHNFSVAKMTSKNEQDDTGPIIVTERDGSQTEVTRSNRAYLTSNVTCTGSLHVTNGRLDMNSYDLTVSENVDVWGNLEVDAGAMLSVGGGKALTVWFLGDMEVLGVSDNPATITSPGYYAFNVNDGGGFAASWAVFEKMNINGVNLKFGAQLDPTHSFNNCVFRNGLSGGDLLTLNNADNILISNASFPTNSGVLSRNVRKTIDAGIVNMANATGVFAGEAYENDNYYRIFWTTATSTPDLRVLKAAWWPPTPNPYLGDTREVRLTLVDASTNPLTQDFYLDLYYNRGIAPLSGLPGNSWKWLSSLPAGLPVDYTFTVENYDPTMAGFWNSWLQIDTFNYVAEANETNNVYGPFTITWQPLPIINDLQISHNAGDDDIVLNWTYPLSVSKFNVYFDTDPYGSFSTLLGSTTGYEFEDNTPGPRGFYQVKAERLPPTKEEETPSRIRN